ATPAYADRQNIAPGTGLQSAVVVDTGPNGICETAAVRDDLQAAGLGRGAPFTDEIRCGPDGIANTAAAGDDRQLIPLGTAEPNTPCVITGANGVADTPDPVGGDDHRVILRGSAAANSAVIR